MLVLVTLMALPMAWVAKERRQSQFEQQLAEQLLRNGSSVALGGPYDSIENRGTNKRQGWWRDVARKALGQRIIVLVNENPQLRSLLGPEFYDANALSNLQYLSINHTQVCDVVPLSSLQDLQHLYMESTQVNDLAPLTSLTGLRFLGLGNTPVHDVTPLAKLKNLNCLYLNSTEVGDLAPLKGLLKLSELHLHGTPVTEQEVEELRKALPKCKIQYTPRP